MRGKNEMGKYKSKTLGREKRVGKGFWLLEADKL